MNKLNRIIQTSQRLLLVLILFSFWMIHFACDRSNTQEDLKDAISLSQTLKKDRSSTRENFSNFPRSHNEEESYTVKKHTLKPGETLQDLAVLYDTDWQSIQQANGIKDLNELKPGQTILIPTKQSNPQQ